MNQDQKPRPWWKWWKDRWPIVVLVALSLVVSVLATVGYLLSWEWTGLVGIPEHSETRLGWDWLELLIIPVLLGLGAFWFNNQARKSEQELAQDRAREEALQRYLDRMQELILDKGLRRSEEDPEIRGVARTRTLAVLRSLDGNRKGQVVRFLYESNLIGKAVREESGERRILLEATIDLRTADLSCANLFDAILMGANLTNANLSNANLSYVNLILLT
jgi:Pentapeptide repeats (8 copies)